MCKDDGKGINKRGLKIIRANIAKESPKDVRADSGFGLGSMKHFGIGVEIDSAGKKQGTTVSLAFPAVSIEAQ